MCCIAYNFLQNDLHVRTSWHATLYFCEWKLHTSNFIHDSNKGFGVQNKNFFLFSPLSLSFELARLGTWQFQKFCFKSPKTQRGMVKKNMSFQCQDLWKLKIKVLSEMYHDSKSGSVYLFIYTGRIWTTMSVLTLLSVKRIWNVVH